MMTDSSGGKLTSLVMLLHTKTREGSISWESTSLEKVYATRLSKYVVNISEEQSRAAQPDIFITLYDDNGKNVETFSDVSLSSSEPSSPPSGFYTLMQELFNMASRQARGVDTAVDDILRALRETNR